jgi:hypothetical protein
MANEKKSDFTVSDRRIFTPEGEVRRDVHDDEPRIIIPGAEQETRPAAPTEEELPPPPTEQEQRESRAAYSQAGETVDQAMREALGTQHRPEALKATFDTFIASLYMSAMLQLGLLHERGEQPQVDIVGARHTIDTLVMIEEKTRGNLTDAEKGLLQDTLFRLRMAFVEVTNMLTRPPEQGPPGAAGKR